MAGYRINPESDLDKKMKTVKNKNMEINNIGHNEWKKQGQKYLLELSGLRYESELISYN